MAEGHTAQPELPNIVKLIAENAEGTRLAEQLHVWENVVFSLMIICGLSLVAYFAGRKRTLIPGKLQNFVELAVGGLDDFICGVLGKHGTKHTPFLGTLFIYILCMNLFGLVPLMHSSTSSWSTTLALAIWVFFYVQYNGLKENGILGYVYHLFGKPKGIVAKSLIIPLILLVTNIAVEVFTPLLSLSLRLRNNVWGDDLLLAVLSNIGIAVLPIIVFNIVLTMLFSVVQATVFMLLSTISLALILPHEE